jgi:hypothetical protein
MEERFNLSQLDEQVILLIMSVSFNKGMILNKNRA